MIKINKDGRDAQEMRDNYKMKMSNDRRDNQELKNEHG